MKIAFIVPLLGNRVCDLGKPKPVSHLFGYLRRHIPTSSEFVEMVNGGSLEVIWVEVGVGVGVGVGDGVIVGVGVGVGMGV